MRILSLSLLFFVGCADDADSGADASADTTAETGAADDPDWVGDWVAVTENDMPAVGTLSLLPTSFTQDSDFGTGTCTWTGSITAPTATTFTITTDTGTGAAGCDIAIGTSATPTWAVVADELTLDYRDAAPMGTLQVWMRE